MKSKCRTGYCLVQRLWKQLNKVNGDVKCVQPFMTTDTDVSGAQFKL